MTPAGFKPTRIGIGGSGRGEVDNQVVKGNKQGRKGGFITDSVSVFFVVRNYLLQLNYNGYGRNYGRNYGRGCRAGRS